METVAGDRIMAGQALTVAELDEANSVFVLIPAQGDDPVAGFALHDAEEGEHIAVTVSGHVSLHLIDTQLMSRLNNYFRSIAVEYGLRWANEREEYLGEILKAHRESKN